MVFRLQQWVTARKLTTSKCTLMAMTELNSGGGAVNLKYVYLTDNFDDSLDWTNGWQGKAQFVYITHEDGSANRGFEGDSHKGDGDTPVSKPVISNVTILPGVDVENASGDKGEGILLRVANRSIIKQYISSGS